MALELFLLIYEGMNKHPDSFDEQRPQNFGEDNVNVSNPFKYPDFNKSTVECRLLKSKFGKRMLNAHKSQTDNIQSLTNGGCS